MSPPLDLPALEAFAETGFFVGPSAIPEGDCDTLVAALSALIERVALAHRGGLRPARSFWELLPASAHGEEVFFDEASGPLGALPAPAWEARAMRIGHGLHLTDPAFVAFCRRPEVAGPLRRFAHVAALLSGGASPGEAARGALLAAGPARLVQSAVIYKQPRSDAVQFGFHRDAAYLPTEPESLVLAFVALDAATPDNGCLEVIPGTHTEPLGLRLRLESGGFTPVGREPRPAAERAVPLPLPRGSIAFVHGRTQHASAPNRSDGPRRALIVHAMSDRSRLAPDAWVKVPPGGLATIE
jgi:phytanoyl-CoA hydroxylase